MVPPCVYAQQFVYWQSAIVSALQMRYIERAPGCSDPPPVPFQHRKTQRKSAPKPGTAEEARMQAEQQKKLAQVQHAAHCCILQHTPPDAPLTYIWAWLPS